MPKQPFINLVRQFIQKVVIDKTPGHQPASLEVHGRIASILAATEAATILEKTFEALKQSEYLKKRHAVELDTADKQKSSTTLVRRSFSERQKARGPKGLAGFCVRECLVAGAGFEPAAFRL